MITHIKKGLKVAPMVGSLLAACVMFLWFLWELYQIVTAQQQQYSWDSVG